MMQGLSIQSAHVTLHMCGERAIIGCYFLALDHPGPAINNVVVALGHAGLCFYSIWNRCGVHRYFSLA
jgi:hypothetical protein